MIDSLKFLFEQVNKKGWLTNICKAFAEEMFK